MIRLHEEIEISIMFSIFISLGLFVQKENKETSEKEFRNSESFRENYHKLTTFVKNKNKNKKKTSL